MQELQASIHAKMHSAAPTHAQVIDQPCSLFFHEKRKYNSAYKTAAVLQIPGKWKMRENLIIIQYFVFIQVLYSIPTVLVPVHVFLLLLFFFKTYLIKRKDI